MVHAANALFEEQFAIRIVVEKLLVATPGHSIPLRAQDTWIHDDVPNRENNHTCRLRHKTRTSALSDWAKYNFRTTCAQWHLFTACEPAEWNSGMAFHTTLCTTRAASYTIWERFPHRAMAFAHEIGHILGARHFQGEDTTDGEGIMALNTGTWRGVHQFHVDHRDDMCTTIRQSMSRYRPRGFKAVATCWADAEEWADASKCPCHQAQRRNGECDVECNVESCEFDDGDCQCDPDCSQASVGNGICDPRCMNEQCNYDDGDCSEPHCLNDEAMVRRWDAHSTCQSLASLCHSKVYGSLMRQTCPKSCGVCVPSPPDQGGQGRLNRTTVATTAVTATTLTTTTAQTTTTALTTTTAVTDSNDGKPCNVRHDETQCRIAQNVVDDDCCAYPNEGATCARGYIHSRGRSTSACDATAYLFASCCTPLVRSP
eukprot:GEMP01036096.1.p1 GENE.GEMP01036096.1~~GEMP01036096.1.p1  ORF type:complete len:429 (+),score=107.48 GEMP01036096.1:147-1433(+)